MNINPTAVHNPCNQIRGKINNAQGHIFEDQIKRACQSYAQQGRAVIDKTPEPFMVISKQQAGKFTGRFTALAQPDFQGTLSNGRSIVFEAKYTREDRMKRNVLTQTQMETLEAHSVLGAMSLVVIGIQDKFFSIPWTIWRDMKQHFGRQYVTPKDLIAFRVKFNSAVMFLDLLRRDIKIAPATKAGAID